MLWNLRDRFAPGVLFGLYLVLAGLERLLIELIRRNDAVVAGLTQAQLISLAMIAARGGSGHRGCVTAARSRGPPERPEQRRRRTAPAPRTRPAALPRWCEA